MIRFFLGQLGGRFSELTIFARIPEDPVFIVRHLGGKTEGREDGKEAS